MNVNNNTAPFLSITWHQKDPLGCVVNSHGQTNDSYNKCIHGSCLLCNYVTKPFGILQRVIVSQRVLIIPYIWTQQKSTSFLSEKFVAKFSDVIFNFPVSWKSNYQTKFQTTYQCAAFKKKCCFFFFLPEEMSPHFKVHMETFSYFVKWVYFLTLTFYQVNRTGDQKLIQKCWSSRLECVLCAWDSGT